MKKLALVASIMAVSVTVWASTTSIGKLTLSGDDTLEVADTTHLYVLDATTNCTLTITGGGDLNVYRVLSPQIKFKLESGRIRIGGDMQIPTTLTTAQFRLDASNHDSLTTETVTSEGRTYVSKWADANGGSVSATAGNVRPYLTVESGRTWVDFGSLKGETLEGYGGYMSVPAVTAIREAFLVVKPDDSVKSAAVRTTVLTDSSQWTVFLSGASYAGYWPELVWQWNGYNKPSGYLMDGIYKDGTKMWTGGSWSAGVHVYDLQIEDGASDSQCKFSSLCQCAEGKSTGGFRVGEIVTFTAHLADADREVVNGYLNAKWMSDYEQTSAERFELSEGTSAQVWTDDGWETYHFHQQIAVTNLTDDTTINVNADETKEIYVLSSDAARTLTKTGSGVLKICTVDSPDITLSVEGGEIVFDDPSTPAAIVREGASIWLDAEAEDTLTTSGGQITSWAGANGTAVSAAAGAVGPTLGTENGRTMVDFGSCAIASPAYMTLSDTITGVREAFLIAKIDETVATAGKRVSVFGTSGWTAFQAGFYQGTYCEIFNSYQISTSSDHYTYQLDGGLTCNGVSVGNRSGWVKNLTAYGFKLTDPDAGKTDYAKISSLCDGFCRGGFKVGEIIAFKQQLSDANRELMNAYLQAKWISEKRYRVAKIESSEGGSVKVLNGGTLEVVELPSSGLLNWSTGTGTVKFNPLNRQAMIHLDAQDEDSMVKSVSEDKTLVTRWNDTDGGEVYASTSGTAPYVTADGGRTYMDFGTGKNSTVEGYGASLEFSEELTGIRDVFFVARPDESLITGRLRAGVIDNATWFVSFQPGFSQSATAYCEIINGYQDYTKQLWNRIYIDGTNVSKGDCWRSGYHLYNFRPCAPEEVGLSGDNAKVNRICKTTPSLNNACGGFRIGELLIFNRALGDAEREVVQRQLRAKWFGEEGNGCDFGMLTIDVGGAMAVPCAVVSVQALNIGGTLEAQSVAAQAIVPLAANAAVSGTLDLTSPGTVTVDSAVFGSRTDAFRVLAADAVSGTAIDWTITGDLAGDFKLKSRVDGLYAIPRRGMLLIVK